MLDNQVNISDLARAVLALEDEVQTLDGEIDTLQRRINSLMCKREALKETMVKLWKGE